MKRRPPRSRRTDTPFPSTPLFRSPAVDQRPACDGPDRCGDLPADADDGAQPTGGARPAADAGRRGRRSTGGHRLYVADRGRSADRALLHRSEEHTSELQSLMRISYAVFCLKTKRLSLKKTSK